MEDLTIRKLCMNCKVELNAVTTSDLCLLCLDTATNQRSPLQGAREAIMNQRPTTIVARGDQMEEAKALLQDAYDNPVECAVDGCDVRIAAGFTLCWDHSQTPTWSAGDSQTVKSDGGSTSYYELPLSERMIAGILAQIEAGEQPTLQTGDVIELLVGNDFDAGNVIKALRRIFESKKGKGKEGVEQTYDIKKCHYFIDEVEKKL